MSAADPVTVVAGYDQRAVFAAADARHTPTPAALPALLAGAEHVVEVPCAAGHHLAAYATAGCRVTLIDANRTMLTAATNRATQAGITSDRCAGVAAFVQSLPPLEADLLVVPNAAVNQLGCQLDLATLLGHLAHAVPVGARILAPILCTRAADTDTSTFYDPHAAHGQWFTDRTFDPAAGGAVRRLRRQHRDANSVRLDFDYRSQHDTSLLRATVTLRIYERAEILAACRPAGLTGAHLSTGDRLTELIATVGPAR